MPAQIPHYLQDMASLNDLTKTVNVTTERILISILLSYLGRILRLKILCVSQKRIVLSPVIKISLHVFWSSNGLVLKFQLCERLVSLCNSDLKEMNIFNVQKIIGFHWRSHWVPSFYMFFPLVFHFFLILSSVKVNAVY